MKIEEKRNKGITLIALIITIIVLLILAGITINALTGSDSAPAKANEAEQKNDIGSAKDQISLTAINAKTDAYDTAYVGNGVSSSEAATTIGQAVIDAVLPINGTNTGKASISVVQEENAGVKGNALITISTRDFEIEGKITLQDGILTWGEIEDNVPRIVGLPEILTLDMGTSIPINVILKKTSGNISWSSSDSEIARYENGTIKVATTIEDSNATATITASADGCKSKTCIVTVRRVEPPQIGDNIILGNAIDGVGEETNTDDWVILYDGREENDDEIKGMFCILTDYLPNDNEVISLAGLEAISDRIYNVRASNRSGPALITSLKDENQTVWKKLVSSNILGNYYLQTKAYGALSYSTMNKILKATKASKFYRASSAGNYETHKCYGYWLAQVGDYATDVQLIYYDGKQYTERAFNDFSFSMNGVCPVVILPSNIQIEKNSNGVWEVVTPKS